MNITTLAASPSLARHSLPLTTFNEHESEYGLDGALDALQMGVVIVDAHLKAVKINAAGHLILDREDGLMLRDGSLTARRKCDQRALLKAHDAASRGQVGAAAVWPFASLQPYLVTLTPLASPCACGTSNHILVAITDPGTVPDEAILTCARALGLTPGESKLALALVSGDTVAEHADKRGVSVHTVRSQLRSIREKLGVSRQSQLVAWLCRATLAGRHSFDEANCP